MKRSRKYMYTYANIRNMRRDIVTWHNKQSRNCSMLANLPTYLVLFLNFPLRTLLLGEVRRLQLFPLPRQPHLIQSI